MSQNSPFAFGSLDARARGELISNPRDRISLRDHICEVEIGAFQMERGTTQRVSFDIVVEVAAPAAPLADDVDRILSYEMLVQAITDELAAERLNLLETLAERIAARILRAPQAVRVFLRIQKLDLGPGALGVEIVRSQDRDAAHTLDDAAISLPHPLVVYFSNAAISSRQLPNWLDQLEGMENPVILCVGSTGMRRPSSAVTPAQRRIDLLAIEQNAWVLAGRDRRCLVVNTRAEFEWAARNHRLSVWAPSKIVLDAVDGMHTDPGDAVALAGWFAQTMQAERLIAVGETPPKNCTVPVTAIRLDQDIT